MPYVFIAGMSHLGSLGIEGLIDRLWQVNDLNQIKTVLNQYGFNTDVTWLNRVSLNPKISSNLSLGYLVNHYCHFGNCSVLMWQILIVITFKISQYIKSYVIMIKPILFYIQWN